VSYLQADLAPSSFRPRGWTENCLSNLQCSRACSLDTASILEGSHIFQFTKTHNHVWA